MTRFRITIVCENSVGPLAGTLGEHGFSALVEPAAGEPLLFDTGQGQTLLHNAARMNKDLGLVDRVVISHGHYDHAGGLLPLLQRHGPKRVLGHPDIFTPRYRIKDTGECTPIGLPQDRQTLEGAGASFDLSAEFIQIGDWMYLSGQIPRTIPFETGDCGLYRDCSSRLPDTTPDDQSLVLDTTQGLVFLLGCCHAGLVNTIEHVCRHLDRRDIHAVIGGTHLGFCGRPQLDGTLKALRDLGVRRVAASHCTGFAAATLLAAALPGAFQPAMVGYTLEI